MADANTTSSETLSSKVPVGIEDMFARLDLPPDVDRDAFLQMLRRAPASKAEVIDVAWLQMRVIASLVETVTAMLGDDRKKSVSMLGNSIEAFQGTVTRSMELAQNSIREAAATYSQWAGGSKPE